MQFAAALVEYLVVGIIACLWFVPIVMFSFPDDYINYFNLSSMNDIGIAVMFPVAYVLGIYVDAASSFMLSMERRLGRWLIQNDCYRITFRKTYWRFKKFLTKSKKKKPYQRTVKILIESPEDLTRAMEAYVTRDRIARGVALNAFIGAIVCWVVTNESPLWGVIALCFALSFLSVVMWHRLKNLSNRFKISALRALKDR